MNMVTTRSVRAARERLSLFVRAIILPVVALVPLEARGELGLAMDLGPDPLRPAAGGSQLDVRLTVTNRGTAALDDVVVEVPLPEELLTVARLGIIGGTCDSVIGNVNNCNHPERVLFNIGSLPPGGGRTVGFSAFVSGLPDGSTVRLAALGRAQGQEVTVESSVTVRSAPAFELSVSGDRDPAGAGEELDYTVTWGHVATARAAPGARLQLELPDGAGFVSATGGGVHSGGLVHWGLGDLDPGDSGEERVVVRLGESIPDGSLLRARAEVRDEASTPETARAHAVTRVQSGALLELALELGPDPLRPGLPGAPALGRTLDVRLTVTNRASFTLPGVVLQAPLPARLLTLARLGIVGGSCDSVIGNVNNCDHPERAVFDLGDLASGDGRTVGFSVFARDLPDGSILGLDAFAAAADQQAVAERAITVRSAPAFELSVAGDREPAGAGEELTYTVTWGHVATARAAPGARLQLELPDGAGFVSATGGGVHSGGVIRWALGDLDPGDSGEARVLVRLGEPIADGTLLAARAEIRDEASTPESARAHAVIRVQSGAALTVTFDNRPTTARRGEAVEVALTATNGGAVRLPGAVLVVPLPERLATLNRLSIPDGTCTSVVGNVNNCNLPEHVVFDLGALEAGETRAVGFMPQVLASAEQAADGSLIRFRAFLRGEGGQATAAKDLRIGEVSVSPTGRFVRGDANADGRFDIVDPIFTLGFLFSGTAAPSCLDASDANDSSTVEISDPILSLNFLFGNGPPPAAPSGAIPAACGEDPTADRLDCAAYPPCGAG